MTHSSVVKTFIHHLQTNPSASILDGILGEAIQAETKLRQLFATDRSHFHISDPYVGLIDVFDAPQTVRIARTCTYVGEEEHSLHHVIPLPRNERRESGEPSTVSGIHSFQKRWVAFTQGLLSELCWDNVIAAGGSVLACLDPLAVGEAQVAAMRRWELTEHFIKSNYGKSDIDLFLWGLSDAQARVKIQQIYLAVRNATSLDLACVRTKNTITIHGLYPYRPIQIILRLYKSPAEVLAGFDVDSACVAYDGDRIWANPRAVVALMRQANTVDMSRRSPSYETRLAKYAERGFEIYVPSLRREDIDPIIYYDGAVTKMQGLARLLIFEEKLARREILDDYCSVVYSGDPSESDPENEYAFNNYEISSFRIPQGRKWTPIRIWLFVRQVDRVLNASHSNSTRLHRHAAFCGGDPNIVMRDMCGRCPAPMNDEEAEAQKVNDNSYVRGSLQFIVDDPGRQLMTGSFNPINDGDWSEQAYKKESATPDAFACIIV